MQDGLYHVDVWHPLPTPEGQQWLKYSRHSMARAEQKGFVLPPWVNWADGTVVETLVSDGVVEKRVVRFPYYNDNDIVLVIQPDGFVRTAWLNARSDKHATLDTSKFVPKPKDL